MIEPKLSGRLGNFLFEVAAAYAYSLKHGMEYNVPTIGGGVAEGTIEKYLKWFPKIETGKVLRNYFTYEEPTHAFREIPKHDNIKIIGYFQSELYFKDFTKEVKSLFELPTYPIKAVSIHVRRGDYVTYSTSFPPIDRRYLQPAIKFFTDKGFKKFIVFSDDINWCKGQFTQAHYPDLSFEFSEGRNEIEDLTLMASCEHNIICNSTFSWWGAWLNPNENKMIVSPHHRAGNWFGARVKLDTSNIIPDNWYKIRF